MSCTCGAEASSSYICTCTVQTVNVVVPTPTRVVVGVGQGGARGVQGTQGTQGPAGQDALLPQLAFTYTQGVPSDTWVITHNLNFYPNVTFQDSAGTIIEGEIDYTTRNTITATFSAAFSGKAYLS